LTAIFFSSIIPADMEEEHINPAPKEEAAPPLSTAKKLLIVLAIVFVFAVIAGAFWFGSQRKQEEPETTPTPAPTTEQTPSPTPEEEGSESPSLSPSPTPSPTPEIKEKTIISTPFLDGYRGSNGFGSNGLYILVGKNVSVIQRGFVSFDLSGIPSDATIESATLRLYQTKVVGTPYSSGGDLKIDHLDYGDSLGNEDYGASAISADITTLTNNAAVEWKDADVTDALKNDLSNGRSNSQYRLHFNNEAMGSASNLAYFESADNSEGTDNLPQLVVKYY
jgi:hypothetical protein